MRNNSALKNQAIGISQNSDLTFHLGLTKNASTFIQRKILVEYHRSADLAINSYDPGNGPIIVSNESIYNHIPFGNDKLHNDPDPASHLASRIAGLRERWPHGDVKAWFFFRRQVEWLPSIYAHVCHRIPKPNQQDFERKTRAFLRSRNYRVIDYSYLIKELKSALGSENVLALPFETLQSEDTWDSIREFTGMPGLASDVDLTEKNVNVKRQNGTEAWVMTRRAQLHITRLQMLKARCRIAPIPEPKIHMPDRLARKITRVYADANRAMSKEIGVDLSSLGYY